MEEKYYFSEVQITKTVGFLRNYTKLAMLAMKTYIVKSKIISVKKVPPVRVEPGDLLSSTLVPSSLNQLGIA